MLTAPSLCAGLGVPSHTQWDPWLTPRFTSHVPHLATKPPGPRQEGWPSGEILAVLLIALLNDMFRDRLW